MVKQDQQTVFKARERRVQGLTFFSLLAHVKIEYVIGKQTEKYFSF